MVSMRSLANFIREIFNLQIVISSRFQENTFEKVHIFVFSSKELFSIDCGNFLKFCENLVIRISQRPLLRMPQNLTCRFIL